MISSAFSIASGRTGLHPTVLQNLDIRKHAKPVDGSYGITYRGITRNRQFLAFGQTARLANECASVVALGTLNADAQDANPHRLDKGVIGLLRESRGDKEEAP
jgi:hypothetical protein